MAKIFCVVNQKGGVGKTTTTINLAAAIASLKQRVLFVDLDPQGNGTTGAGINKGALTCTVYQALLGIKKIDQVICHSDAGNFDVLPANKELAGAEIDLVDFEEREYCLKNVLATVSDHYDFVFIDCPPSLSMLTINGLCAAQGIIIPMQCEYYALEGLSDLVNTIKRVHAHLNPELSITGLLRVMFDPRITLTQQVSAQLEQHFGKKVFKTIIPRNVRLAEAPSYGMPGVCFDPSSKGAQAYMAFALELMELIQEEKQS